jgi:ABC-type multidrug transport system ATPase subunit
MPDFAPLILAEELTRRFGDFIAVNQLHVAVHPGEVFGLLGANGAGKTTAIRMLCGMLPPTAGRIQVAGWSWCAMLAAPEPDRLRRPAFLLALHG